MIEIGDFRVRRKAVGIIGAAFLAGIVLALFVILGAPLFESLFAKTFAILGSQLAVTWIFTFAVIGYVRHLYYEKTPGISAAEGEEGQLDLEIDQSMIRPYFRVILVADIVLFVILLTVGRFNLLIGIPIFTLWSMLTGIWLALALISVDENLGSRVLGITATVTFIAALIGIYSGIDFSFLGIVLFIALLGLLVGMTIRLFVSIDRWKQRALSFVGVAIFVGYLLFDFNRLAQLSDHEGANTWPVATDLALAIYLDVINLFLLLLDLLSD